MSAFRDKFAQKNKSKKQQVPDTMESFDQNSLNVTISNVKSQLSPITLTCSWNNASFNKKAPQLQCRWYNKTQTDIKQIVGVNGSNYQSCLIDVGSIVHIQCVPTLPGIQYEGMPIIKEIGPITLDPETQQQSQDLLKSEKATFFVQLSINDNQKIEQGLIKIQQNKLVFLLKKQDKTNEEVYSGTITENNPQIQVNRVKSEEITFIFEGKQTKIRTVFGDHKIRDVFLLFLKLIIGKKFLKQQIVEEQELIALKSKTSATDLINLGDLKMQIVKLESEKQQINKLLRIEKNNREDIELKNQQLQQRLQSLNKNYFQLQKQLKNTKHSESADKEQLSYYKNENQNLKLQVQRLTKNQKQLNQSIQQKTKLLDQFQHDFEGKQNYQTLVQKIKKQDNQIENLTNQLSQTQQQIKKMEEKLIEMEEKYEELYNQKQNITKKYQSLLNQKNPIISPSKLSMLSREVSIQEKSQRNSKEVDKQAQPDLSIIMYEREKQLIQLKQQIRNLIQQNNYIKAIATKQSSKSSKTKLKLQLLDMKKIIGKLTETVTQKDIALQEMRKINKQLNQRLIQLNTMKAQEMFEINKEIN